MEVECFKKFQVRFVMFHRLRLSPHAPLPLASHSASHSVFFFPSVSVDFVLVVFSFLCGDLERSLTRLCGSTAADSSSAD